MPVYCKKCVACKHSFEAVSSMRLSGSIKCPQCGSETETDFDKQGVPACGFRDLHGVQSTLMETAMHPSEVPKARELFGPKVGRYIQPNGQVVVPDTRAARDFWRREKQIKDEFADKKAAKKVSPKNAANAT